MNEDTFVVAPRSSRIGGRVPAKYRSIDAFPRNLTQGFCLSSEARKHRLLP